MNKARRERIEDIKQQLEEVRDEEQEAFDALPESFQQGEQGQAMESNIGEIDSAISSLDNIE